MNSDLLKDAGFTDGAVKEMNDRISKWRAEYKPLKEAYDDPAKRANMPVPEYERMKELEGKLEDPVVRIVEGASFEAAMNKLRELVMRAQNPQYAMQAQILDAYQNGVERQIEMQGGTLDGRQAEKLSRKLKGVFRGVGNRISQASDVTFWDGPFGDHKYNRT